jgi:ammonium transporter Rh
LVVRPWAATVIGIFASAVSVWGYTVLMPILEKRICLFDTCGVHNLHGMPGLIGGITGAIASACVGDSVYGQNIGAVYAARMPVEEGGLGRSAGEQAGIQLLALFITLAIAVTGGLFTGFVVQANVFQPPDVRGLFSDHVDWDDVEEGDAIFEHHAASHDHSGHAQSHDQQHTPVVPEVEITV